MSAFAVIDLGTNTFHLLIAEVDPNGHLKEVVRNRVYVKLAEKGIHRIGDAPLKRGLAAIRNFNDTIRQHPVMQKKAFGTAALRRASNASSFIAKIAEETGIHVDIISGKEEARLIYQGVRQLVSFNDANGLIMDIGGGSVEFILANQQKVIWADSFPIGVALLSQTFHPHDPMPPQMMDQLREHLRTTLQPVIDILQRHPVSQFIGASGTFDVLRANLAIASNQQLLTRVPIHKYLPFHEKVVKSTLAERLAMKSLPASRAEMIVSALLLVQFVLDLTKVEEITISAYAMKEGMLAEMVSEYKI